MKILHLLASPYFSGPAEIVLALAREQRALGHVVAVAVDRKRTELPPAEELAAPRFAAVSLLDDSGLELSVKSSPSAVLGDVGRLWRSPAEILHAHFAHDHIVARFGRRRRAALVRSIHAPRSLRWSLPRADGYTVASSQLETRLPRGARSMVLPALVDPSFTPPADRARLRAELGLSGEPLIGMISTFQPSRRHAVGIEAFARVLGWRPQARLALIGDGVLEPRLRGQVSDLGLVERVHFVGYRSGAEFVAHLQALDEVWVLGLGNDWSGRAAAQARACGVRVVAVDEGALAEYADATVPLALPEAVAQASLSDARRAVMARSPREIAVGVVDFYARCRGDAR